MQEALDNGLIDDFMVQLKVMFSNIKYNWQPPRQYKNEAELFKMWEGYFHAITYVIVSYLNTSVKSEIETNKGRIDLVIETENFVYLMEFKLDETTTKAIEQIKKQDYAASYLNSSKKVFLVGANFSKEDRNVESWEAEIWEK